MEGNILNAQNERYLIEIGSDPRNSETRFAYVINVIGSAADEFGLICRNHTLEGLAEDLAKFCQQKNLSIAGIVNGSLTERLHKLSHVELEKLNSAYYGTRKYLEPLLMATASQVHLDGVRGHLCETSPGFM